MNYLRAGLVPLILLAAWGTMAEAGAQEKKPAPAAPPAAAAATEAKAETAAPAMHVLVVDVQSLLQNSKSAKMVRQQIEAKRAEYAKEISHQEEQLRHERDTLQRQQASLSPAALNQKGREFQQKVNDLDRSVQAKRLALERSNAEALEKIQSAMLKIITDIAKDRKSNLVFQRSELVLFDQHFDITDQVLKKLDEQLPTLTVNFVAPTEEPAPATAAAAAQPAAAAPSHAKHRR
jgi:Skp family chaperone for outer membrane proteins